MELWQSEVQNCHLNSWPVNQLKDPLRKYHLTKKLDFGRHLQKSLLHMIDNDLLLFGMRFLYAVVRMLE